MLTLKLFQKIFPLGYTSDFLILIKTAIPLILSSLSQIFLTIISMFFCGHIGAAELDAASLANTLINIFALTSAYGLSSACDTLFPQLFGGESSGKKKIGLILQKSLIISVIGSFLSSALLLNMKYLIVNVIEDIEVVKLTDEYITIFIPSIFFYNIATLLSKYIQSQNIVYPLMIINFLIILINSGLHALLIFYFELGLKGAAISVNISSFCLMIFIFLYIYFRKIYLSTWPGWSRECLVDWKIYLRLAIPGFLLLLIEWSNFEVATFISGGIGTTELGVMSITQQILYIFYQLPFGLASAGNIYIGQLLGGNQAKRAKNATKVLVSIGIMSMTILGLLLLSLSDYFPYLFSNDAEIIQRTGEVLKLVALIHIFDASQGIGQGIIRSVGGQLYSSVVLFIGFYVFGLPIGICLLLLTPLRSFGYYLGVISGGIVLIILQYIYIFRINWEKSAEIAYKLSKASDELDEEKNKESLTHLSQFSLNIEEAEKKFNIRNKKRKMILKIAILFISVGVFVIGCVTHEIKDYKIDSLNNLTNSTFNVNFTFIDSIDIFRV